jgi:hypothetical protein
MRAPEVLGRETQLGVLVGALALISVAALVGQIYGIVDMTFVLAFLADYRFFYRRLMLGIALGLAATAAYDLVRLAAQTALPLDFNAFAIHARFGELIIDEPRNSTAARIVGWSYHVSNGLTFALCYTLVAGKARWWWGLLYGLTLESLMVVMYPTGFGLSRGNEDFLIVSFIGHATYGSVLGLLNYRFNENEPSRAQLMRR